MTRGTNCTALSISRALVSWCIKSVLEMKRDAEKADLPNDGEKTRKVESGEGKKHMVVGAVLTNGTACPQVYIGRIIDSFEYILEEDMLPAVVHCNSKCATLSFYIPFMEEQDEDGYSPPKDFVMDGRADDEAMKTLKEMGLDKIYNVAEISQLQDVHIETVYVMESKKEKFSRDELEDSRRTRVTIPIKKY